MEWLIKHRGELEIIYFVTGGPLLLAVAVFGLRQIWVSAQQLRLAREIASDQAKRDACKLAAEQCRHYGKEIIEAENAVNALFQSGEMEAFKRVIVAELSSGRFELDDTKAKGWESEFSKQNRQIICLANSLEAFAIWFTCGAADERIAFRPISPTYCDTVKRLLPVMVALNRKHKYYEHALKLYVTWRDRRNSEELLLKREELDKQLRDNSPTEIKPIGT